MTGNLLTEVYWTVEICVMLSDFNFIVVSSFFSKKKKTKTKERKAFFVVNIFVLHTCPNL